MTGPLVTSHGIRPAYRGRTLVRCMLMLTAIVALLGPGLTAARADVDGPARYSLRSGTGPAAVVLRHCHAEDDFGEVRLVDFDGTRTILRCASH